MSKIKLPHASGNSMSIAAPATNPASDLELKLPATIGSAGEVVQNSTTAGTLEMGSPFRPAFSARTSSQFNIAGETWVKYLFQTEYFDTDSAYDTSTSTFTVPANKGGAYQINYQISIDDLDDDKYMVGRIYVNGSAIALESGYFRSDGASRITSSRQSVLWVLNAGDTVNIYTYTNQTGTQTSEDVMNHFSMFRLGGVAT